LSLNALDGYEGADVGITPDDSPARDEYLQGTEVPVKQAQTIQIERENNGGNTIRQIELMLRSKYIFRYNIVSDIVSFKLASNPDAGFEDMTDYNYNSILREIKLADIACSKDTLRTILKSDFVPRYDPYREYIDSLPKWDGRTDYIAQLTATIRTTNDEFFEFCLRKWIVAMIASWDSTEVVNHTALIFTGKQGIGKTLWFSHLIPKPLKRYIHSGRVNVRDKDSLVKLSECPIVIMDELENMDGRNIDALKELITKKDIYVRRAYAYAHENYTRRASFAGSVNSKDFLVDVTGNRRFLCFEALNIDYQHRVDMDKVFSQALHLAKNGFQFWFSADEIAALEANNEEFRAVCSEEEQLTTFYEQCGRNDDNVLCMKTSDIAKSLCELSRLRSISEQKLGRVLHKLGFERFKHQGRYVYALKLKRATQTTV